jgi:hypothetical protein
MIHTVADLFDDVRRKEAEALNRYDIQHPSMIGSMYEGLTKRLVQDAIFDNLDLRVVDGKIRNEAGKLSGQIDCMLVYGEGERVPYTDSWVYPPEQVLVVIEVKKNLYATALRDAYSSLRSLQSLTSTSDRPLGLARSSFRVIAGLDASIEDLPLLSAEMQMLFGCLAKDQLAPARIVMGYFGFKTKWNLRHALIEYLQQEMDRAAQNGEKAAEGFGPASFPSLILCNESALVKLNAMPYGAPILNGLHLAPEGDQDGWWPFFGSMTGQNGLALLEIVWTRLRDRFDLPASIFGEDLEIESPNPLLFTKPVSSKGWGFVTCEALSSQLIVKSHDWKPVLLTEAQGAAIAYLAERSEVELDSDLEFRRFAEDSNSDIARFATDLQATGLVFIDANRRLRFLTYGCDVVFLPDGRIAAGENSTGRLTRWALREMEQREV